MWRFISILFEYESGNSQIQGAGDIKYLQYRNAVKGSASLVGA